MFPHLIYMKKEIVCFKCCYVFFFSQNITFLQFNVNNENGLNHHKVDKHTRNSCPNPHTHTRYPSLNIRLKTRLLVNCGGYTLCFEFLATLRFFGPRSWWDMNVNCFDLGSAHILFFLWGGGAATPLLHPNVAGSSEKLTPCWHADIYLWSVRPKSVAFCFWLLR